MLRLQVFGAVSFQWIDGEPTRLAGRAGSLLAFLALSRGRFFSRGELVSVLWPEQGDAVQPGTFNTLLWRLRKLVEGTALAHGGVIACDRRGSVGLHPQAPLELDVEAFAAHVVPVLAKPLERMTEADIEALERGVALYTSDILTDLSDEWALREREKHRRHYLNALGRMMQMRTLAGDRAGAIRHAQAILDRDMLREDVHRDLMRLYLASGQRALALRQFEQCRAALRRELAIQPMQETLALYRGIAQAAVAGEAGGFEAESLAPLAGAVTAFAATAADIAATMSARELIESARRHLAQAEAQLQLSLPFL